jgi:DNA repair exonuclease SbcCD ATPase subunit
VPVFATERGSRITLSLPETDFAELNEAKTTYEQLLRERKVTEQRLRTLEREREDLVEKERRELAQAIKKGKTLKDQGKREERIEKEVAACKRRLEAIEEALDDAENDLIIVLDGHRDEWIPDVEGSLDEILSEYSEAVEALAEVRARVSSKYTLLRWLRGFPETEQTYNVAPGIALLPRLRAAHGEPYRFDEVLEALREDAQSRPKSGPLTPHDVMQAEVQRIHEERLANESAGREYLTNDELRRKREDPVAFEHGLGGRIVKTQTVRRKEENSPEVVADALLVAPDASEMEDE